MRKWWGGKLVWHPESILYDSCKTQTVMRNIKVLKICVKFCCCCFWLRKCSHRMCLLTQLPIARRETELSHQWGRMHELSQDFFSPSSLDESAGARTSVWKPWHLREACRQPTVNPPSTSLTYSLPHKYLLMYTYNISLHYRTKPKGEKKWKGKKSHVQSIKRNVTVHSQKKNVCQTLLSRAV